MMADRRTTDLRTEIASVLEPVLERERREAGPHPGIEELIRYHGGELDEAGEERVQGHLLACAECQEDLLDLDGFVDAARGRPTGELGGTARTPGRAVDAPPAAPSRSLVLALAASLLVAVAGLGVWAIQERRAAGDLRHQVAELSLPRPDVPIVDLLPDSSVRGEESARPPATVPPEDELVTFVLNLPQAPEVSGFEAELAGPDGEVVWSGPVERSPYGTFTLGVWRRSLSAGESRVRVYGLEPGGRRLLETYTFRVEPREEVR